MFRLFRLYCTAKEFVLPNGRRRGHGSRPRFTSIAFLAVVSVGHAKAQTCSGSSLPYTLTNGSVADASQVMADLNCAGLYGLAHSGNIGIGTTSPQNQLQVVGGITTTSGGQAQTAAGPALDLYFDSTNIIGRIDSVYSGVAWEPLILSSSTFSVLSGGLVQGLYQGPSGNVGVGLTNPSANLAVAGQIMQVGAGLNLATSDSNLIFGDWPNSTGWQQLYFNHVNQEFNLTAGLKIGGGLGVNTQNDTIFTVANGALPTTVDHPDLGSFYTNYDSWDSVLIARASVNNPQELTFGVNQGGGYSEIQATQGGVGTNQLVLNRQGGTVSIATEGGYYSLFVGGTVYAYGGAGALSDVREKDQIAAMPAGAISLVQQLRPVTFVWRKPKDDGMQGQQMGFIAQEVEKVLPSAVLTGKDAKKTKGLKYNELVAVLTKAVQEQEAEIQALKQQVAALKPSSSQ